MLVLAAYSVAAAPARTCAPTAIVTGRGEMDGTYLLRLTFSICIEPLNNFQIIFGQTYMLY